MANFNFSLGFNVEKEGINKAKQELAALKQELQRNPAKFNIEVGKLPEALQQISVFEGALKKAFNQNLGKLDTKEFLNQVHAAGYSLEEMKKSFQSLGVDANASMNSIERGMRSTNLSLKKTNETVEAMADTFKNTLKWNLASQAIHGIEGSIGRAIGFTKDLDNSLNNIRIVTGKGKDEMDVFAKSANDAAKALGKSTVEYSDASLLFFQQGKSASEVRDLTKATLIGASITGQDVAETSELLTAAMNGYNLAASEAMSITDKFAAVGASTGSDFNELAIGFSKVASMASTAGVSVDQLNGMLATTSTVTREAPESIGTSFKTIFGRMTDLQAGKEDEEGWKLGKVNNALEKAGFSMTDEETGKLKDTGLLMEEIGDKWATLNKESQLALSVAMAGSRQQNRLIALFNNWDMYKEALKESQEAEGTAYEQNLIRMDSLEYKSKQLRASLEEMWMKVIDSDAMKGLLEGLTALTEGANNFVDSIGGIEPILVMVSAALSRLMSNKTGTFGVEKIQDFKDYFKNKADDKSLMNTSTKDMTPEKQLSIKRLQQEYNIRKNLTQQEHQEYIEIRKTVEAEETKLEILKKQQEQARKVLDDKYKGSLSVMELAAKENQNVIKDGQKALKELQALRDKKITIDQISQSTLALEDVTKAELSNLMAQDDEMDSMLQNLYREIDARKKENELIKERGKLLSAAHTREINDQQSRVSKLEDDELSGGKRMESLNKKALDVEKVQNVIDKSMAGVVAVTAFTASVKSFKEAGDDVEAQADAISAGMMGLSGSLMMLPHPMAQIAGLALVITSAFGKWAWENTGLNKTIKENKELLEETTKTISDAKTKLQNLGAASQTFKDLKDYMKDGAVSVGDLGESELAKYYELSNKVAELAPDMVAYYDEQGNAIVNLNDNLDRLKDAQREQIRLANEAKLGNASGFAEEYSSKIELAQSKLEKNKEILDAMSKGQSGLDAYNAKQHTVDPKGMDTRNGKTYNMEDMGKVTAEMQEQQALLQTIGEDVRNNLINPLFEGSKAYGDMTAKQKEMVRGLLTAEQATKMAHDPELLKSYTAEVSKAMNVIGAEGKLVADITDKITKNQAKILDLQKEGVTSEEQNKIDLLVKENGELQKQAETMTVLSDKFAKLGEVKEQSLIKTLGTLKLEGEEYKKAFENLTEYYSSAEALRNGPLDQQSLANIAGTEPVTNYDANIDSYNSLAATNVEEVDAISAKMTELGEKMRALSFNGLILQEDRDAFAAMTEEMTRLGEQEQSLIDKQYELSQLSVEAGLAAVEQTIANNELEEQYWEQIDALAETAEGYNQLAEIYNSNIEAVGAMKELMKDGSPLKVDEGEMDSTVKSLEKYRDQFPQVAAALDEYKKHGSSAYGKVQDAMKEVVQQQGRMYAAMNKDDVKYYQEFLSLNKKQTNQMFVEYGVRAQDFNTWGEYEEALHKAREKGKLSATQQRINQDIINNAKGVNANAEGMKTDIKNTGKAATQKGSIWKQLTNSGLTLAEKWGLGWRAVADGVSRLMAGVVNGIIDRINGGIGAIEKLVNAAVAGINSVGKMLPGSPQASKVSFGKVGHVSGSNLAGSYSAGLAEKYKASDPNFNYNTGMDTVSPKPIGGGTGGGSSPGTSGPGVGSGGGGGGGKGGGGSDGAEEKKVEDMTYEKDILHDTNVLLEQQENLLKRLKDEEETLYGKAKMDNLTKQNAALAEKKKLLGQQLAILRAAQAAEKESLSKQGVKFSENGTITNYDAIIQSKVKAANALSGDAKTAAIEKVKEFMEDLKKYEDFQLKAVVDKEDAIREVEKLQHEIYLEQFEYKIKVQLELSKDQDDYLKFLKDVNSEFDGISESYEATVKQLNTALGEAEVIQEHINRIMADTSLTEGERIEQAKKYEKELQQATVTAKKLRGELVKINEEAVKEGLDLLNKHLDKFETLGKELTHVENMMRLIGQGKNYAQLDKIYEAQNKNLQAQLDTAMKGRDALSDYVGQLEIGSEEWEYANAQVDKMNEQINKLTEQTLKAFQDEFKNTVNGIVDALDKSLSGGMGLDKVKEQWADLKKEQAKYLSTEERIVSVGKLHSKIQKQINESNNPETRKILEEFMDNELQHLTVKEDLSESDMERAQKLYDITQKQIALEEARNNRTIQRLVRDAAGNWSYQYVEDTRKVEEARVQLSDKLSELMAFDEKEMKANQDAIIALKEAHVKKLQEITAAGLQGEYATQEAFYAALEEAEKDYNAERERLGLEHTDKMQNYSESSLAAVLDAYRQNSEGLGVFKTDQEKLLTELADTVGTKWTSIQDAVILANTGSATSFKDQFKIPVESDANSMFSTLTGIFDSLEVDWGSNVVLMRGSWRDSFFDMQEKLESLESEASTSASLMKDNWKTNASTMQTDWAAYLELMKSDVATKSGDMGDTWKDSTDALKSQWGTTVTGEGGIIGLTQTMGTNITGEFSKIKTSFTDNITSILPGEWDAMTNGEDGLTGKSKKLYDAINGDFVNVKDKWAQYVVNMKDSWGAAATGEGGMKLISEDLYASMDGNFTSIRDAWGKVMTNESGTGILDNTKTWKSDSSIAVEAIKKTYDDYRDKVDEVSVYVGEDLAGLSEKTAGIVTDTDLLTASTTTLIGKISEEWSAVGTLVSSYQVLDGQYDALIDASVLFCKQLDEQIRKQQEAATGVNTPGVVVEPPKPTPPPQPAPQPTPPPQPAPTPPQPAPQPTPSPAPTPKAPSEGGIVRVKADRTWYHDSYGKAPTGPTTPYSNRDLYVVNTSNNKYKYAVGSTKDVSSALGWVNLSDLQGFRSGGYTGEWGNDGKVAMLHEKEIVLNKEDTRNILDAVGIVRDYASMIKRAMGGGMSAAIAGVSSGMQQNVTINADFSGVKSSSEIEKAFENIANRASQFARRK
jgi:TP901 family phage tail tape measure protein